METTPLQGPRDTLPPPRRRRPWPAVVAAAGAFALAVLAATTVNPAAGVAVIASAALSNAWPGEHQYNTSFACVWHEPHWRIVHGLAIGHYECFNTSAQAAAASADRPFVFDVTGDDDDYNIPYKWDCAAIDDDTVFSEDACGKADFNACWDTSTEWNCANGTACFDWCGGACENGWWSYCIWDVVAHAPEACNGTFDPAPPARRLRTASGKSCAMHSYCAPCGNDNVYCNDIYSKFRDNHGNNTDESMQSSMEFLTPSTMESWCGAWNLTYRNRSQAGVSAIASDHMPNVTDIADVHSP